MSRSERIAGIARIAERAERDAAEALMAAKQRLEQVEARLAELRRYREEYGVRMRRDQSAGLSIGELRRHQHFMRRLEEGVAHACASVARTREEWRRSQEHWREQRSRLDADQDACQIHAGAGRLDGHIARGKRRRRTPGQG